MEEVVIKRWITWPLTVKNIAVKLQTGDASVCGPVKSHCALNAPHRIHPGRNTHPFVYRSCSELFRSKTSSKVRLVMLLWSEEIRWYGESPDQPGIVSSALFPPPGKSLPAAASRPTTPFSSQLSIHHKYSTGPRTMSVSSICLAQVHMPWKHRLVFESSERDEGQ